MLIYNHKLIGANILKYSKSENLSLINRNRFIWGNIKPDCVMKYKKMDHYFNESIDIIIDKILYLSSLTVSDVRLDISVNKFSEELGVVCHFLCDFFCAPHYYRWKCTSTRIMKDHMLYEKRLATATKKFVPTAVLLSKINPKDIRKFIVDLQGKYEGEIHFYNDLTFSYYVCNSVISMILENIIKNERISVQAI